MVDVLIIGAGCAGLTAAIYATRAGHRVVVLEKLFHGGQISVTNEVENYPAIDRISGPDLANRIYEQAAALGADVRYEDVSEVDLAGPVKRVTTSGGEYEARAVIIANGVQRRKLQCPGEEKFLGRGVSYCATCDGAFFKGKDTAVVGGGNTALEDALFLANLCRTVYLVHRRDSFRGEKVLAEAVAQRPNIRPLFNKTVESIHGGQSVEGAALLDTVTGAVRGRGAGRERVYPGGRKLYHPAAGGVRGGGHPHQVAAADHYRRGRRGGGRHPGGALPGNRGAGAIGGGAFTGLMVDAVAELWYA